MESDLSKVFPLRKTRVHEVCGPSAAAFAFALAGQMRAQVLWVKEKWRTDQINPTGFLPYIDPAQVLFTSGKHQNEVLAAAEESLRSSAVDLTVVELSKPLDLVAGRRLQLAAKAGKSTGVCLISDGMGSNASETRWHCTPRFDSQDSTLQRWKLIKNKSGMIRAWDVRWNTERRHITVVPKSEV